MYERGQIYVHIACVDVCMCIYILCVYDVCRCVMCVCLIAAETAPRGVAFSLSLRERLTLASHPPPNPS